MTSSNAREVNLWQMQTFARCHVKAIQISLDMKILESRQTSPMSQIFKPSISLVPFCSWWLQSRSGCLCCAGIQPHDICLQRDSRHGNKSKFWEKPALLACKAFSDAFLVKLGEASQPGQLLAVCSIVLCRACLFLLAAGNRLLNAHLQNLQGVSRQLSVCAEA